jgi:hypothetical protein
MVGPPAATEVPPVKKLVLTAMLAAFAAAVTLPIVVANDAFAAAKKTSKMDKEKIKKKPAGKM